MIEREAKGVGKDPCVPEKIKSSQETKRQEEDAEAMGASPVSGLSRPHHIDICWQNPRVSPGSASYATQLIFVVTSGNKDDLKSCRCMRDVILCV